MTTASSAGCWHTLEPVLGTTMAVAEEEVVADYTTAVVDCSYCMMEQREPRVQALDTKAAADKTD